MKKVLHITTHMGGGVGKVLSGISSYANKYSEKYIHKIILLEKPQKMNFINICRESGVEVKICESFDEAYDEIRRSDITQIEWWNHPKMSEFMADFPKIKTRLIIWAHISGCSYPNIPPEFIKIPSKFLFTSEYSYENPTWSESEREYIKKNTRAINSSGGFEKIEEKKLINHDGFNIGYIGTLNYSKLNEQFYKYYKSIDIEDVKFTIIGDIENSKNIISDLKNSNLYDKSIIKDYVDDVGEEMKNFDVFSYLLNKEHFGTTENILLEAMAMGLPVICINQCAEKFLINNMETGILINTVEEYKNAINYLYENP
ncbi:MAG: glycosyltransferase, partial [Paraclostridium sp.]